MIDKIIILPSNFSQQWLLDRQDILRERQADLKVLTEDEYQKVMIFFSNCEFIYKSNWL